MTKLQNIEQKSKIYKHKIDILKGILGENVVDEQEINNNLLEILKKETASLKKQYIEMTEEWAKTEFNRLIETNINGTAKYDERNQRFYPSSINNTQRENGIINEVNLGIKDYIDRKKRHAELHYEDSIIKLAHRIEQKGLDKSKLKVQTAHVGVNIETVLTDGKKTVKAWTIIAGGAIQRPHYRYLVK